MKKSSHSQGTHASRIASAIALFLRDFAYRGRTILVTALLLAVLLAGGTFTWRKWSASIARLDQYAVKADRIHLTPPPPWLKANIAAQALEDAGLSESLSLIDTDLINRLVEALELHPWVARVTRIQTQIPARVDAEVVYREPTAAIEAGKDRQSALYPIDAKGYRLPASDVPAAMLVRLPRIADSTQLPLVGQAFRGPRTAGAIDLVASLSGDWEALSLWMVSSLERPETHSEEQYFLYDVIASGGTRIHWGAAPSAAPSHESPPEQKLSRLKAYLEANGVNLNSVRSPEVIDVRREVQVKPRIAARPDEPTE